MLFLFFFQAEDGIRDHCVTGVQTCALPISPPRDPAEEPVAQRQAVGLVVLVQELVLQLGHVDVGRALGLAARSEERRVGKEWRSRWSPEHENKTTMSSVINGSRVSRQTPPR